MSFHEPHLLVRAGGRSYAIPGPRILRIVRYEDAAEARVDLSHMLGGEAAVVRQETPVVVVGAEADASIGLVVDEATGIVTYRGDELLAPPDFGPATELTYVAALAPQGDTFAIVLDLDRLLAEWKADA